MDDMKLSLTKHYRNVFSPLGFESGSKREKDRTTTTTLQEEELVASSYLAAFEREGKMRKGWISIKRGKKEKKRGEE